MEESWIGGEVGESRSGEVEKRRRGGEEERREPINRDAPEHGWKKVKLSLPIRSKRECLNNSPTGRILCG
jgi:hypothetical protein